MIANHAFNIFNSGLGADNWPTGMDEADLNRFKPRKMGYLCTTPPK